MIFQSDKNFRKYFFRTAVLVLLLILITFSVSAYISVTKAKQYANRSLSIKSTIDQPNQKKLILTFDDGPHSVNTPLILDILKRNDVHATFFLLGENIIGREDIVRRIYNEGHDIGNHTFTHSDYIHKSEWRVRWELNSTNKVLEQIIGHSTKIYRPPYLLDIYDVAIPDPKSARAVAWAADNGYITVGADIDPRDWAAKSSSEVIENIKEDLESTGGNIILLHDGENEVKDSSAVLETIIREFRKEGYEFETVSQYLGVSRSDIMPPAPRPLPYTNSLANYTSLSVLALFKPTSNQLIQIALILIGLRIVFVLSLFILSIRQQSKDEKKATYLTDFMDVSVVIPAYNEEENISSTLQSILRNTYPVREIIIVDDGSTDGTIREIERIRRQYPSIVRFIHVQNGGKARALNIAFQRARSQIVVAIDGDTILDKNAIAALMLHFLDKNVGAVAGKVKVANHNNLLAIFQNLEYNIVQNIEKRAFSLINGVGVIPGAIGAWRKQEVIAVGGYTRDTLAEDQDLTLSILRRGKRIVYEPRAICYTEVPQTFQAFMKQRFRWTFGSLQCFWKHKQCMFSLKAPVTGWIVLPNLVLYGILLPFFSPLADLAALILILTGNWEVVLLPYLFFMFFDLLYATVGLWREGRILAFVWALPIQRIFYRQAMYYLLIKSCIKAVEGSIVSWNALQRFGHAKSYFLEQINRPATHTPDLPSPADVGLRDNLFPRSIRNL